MIIGVGNGIGFERKPGSGGPTPAPVPVASPATNINPTAFQANWQAYPSAVSYELEVSDNVYFNSPIYILTTVDTFFGVVGLVSNTTYYYRVRATLVTGAVSLFSNTISVTTL